MKSESSSRQSGGSEGEAQRAASDARIWDWIMQRKEPRHWRRCHLGGPQKRPRYYHSDNFGQMSQSSMKIVLVIYFSNLVSVNK